jgi:hypothetical protein
MHSIGLGCAKLTDSRVIRRREPGVSRLSAGEARRKQSAKIDREGAVVSTDIDRKGCLRRVSLFLRRVLIGERSNCLCENSLSGLNNRVAIGLQYQSLVAQLHYRQAAVFITGVGLQQGIRV